MKKRIFLMIILGLLVAVGAVLVLHNITKPYFFEVKTEMFSIRVKINNKAVIENNTREEIEQRIKSGMLDVMGDLATPDELKGLINEINRKCSQEKITILEGFQKSLKNRQPSKIEL